MGFPSKQFATLLVDGRNAAATVKEPPVPCPLFTRNVATAGVIPTAPMVTTDSNVMLLVVLSLQFIIPVPGVTEFSTDRHEDAVVVPVQTNLMGVALIPTGVQSE